MYPVILLNLKGLILLKAWLYHILRSTKGTTYQMMSYFSTWLIDIHKCTGSSETSGEHIEIVQPRRTPEFQVNNILHKQYSGSIIKYFHDIFSTINNKPSPSRSCWRVKDSTPLCHGTREDQKDLIISIPIILSVEVSDHDSWDFPSSIYPDTKATTMKHGLVYDLIGLVLFNPTLAHFTARYASSDKKTIYTYDGMLFNGFPKEESNATFSSHVSGKNINLPDGYVVYQAFYYLRGGLAAQKEFYRLRTLLLSQRLNLDFVLSAIGPPPQVFLSLDSMIKLDPSDRLEWTRKTTTTEYILRPQSPTSMHISLSPPRSLAISLPNSLFSINCRCGMVGDGNILYCQDDGEAIQCDICEEWSHIACQRDGRADNLSKTDKFMCDFCDIRKLHAALGKWVSKRK